jgi:hypothetical protein
MADPGSEQPLNPPQIAPALTFGGFTTNETQMQTPHNRFGFFFFFSFRFFRSACGFEVCV